MPLLHNPRFSIVIPAYNTCASLQMVLECLQKQEFPDDLAEILVVDDGSTDGTAEILRRNHSRFALKFWSNPVSLGRSAARNLAWRNAVGEIILFLDADMLPEPGWLQGYAQAFAQSDCEVLSGGRYHLDLGNDPQSIPQRLAEALELAPESLFAEDRNLLWRRLAEVAQLGQYPDRVQGLLETQLRDVCRDSPRSLLCAYSMITSNVGVRRAWLERVNGFDPFMLKRSEDTDLAIRLWEIGARFGFAPSSSAYHLFTSVGQNRVADLFEFSAFLHRHPYQLIPFLYLWFVYNKPDAPVPPAPFFRSLPLLAQQGAALMDFDIGREFLRVRHGRLCVDCQFSKEAMAAYLVETLGIDRNSVTAYLDLALEQGIFAQRRHGKVYLDLFHTYNWLRTRTPLQEYDAENVAYLPNNKPPFFCTRRSEDLLSLRCRGVYEMRIDLLAIGDDGARAAINLPVPMEIRGQTGVCIHKCYPGDLLEHLDPLTQMIRNYPLTASEQGPAVLRYHFECETHELTTPCDGLTTAGDPATAEDLKPGYPTGTLPQLQALLKRIQVNQALDTRDSAAKIYRYLLDNIRFMQTTLPDFCMVSTGFGPCVYQARLFVNLCRLLRIPARERCGAVFEGPCDPKTPSRVAMEKYGFSPFLHTWAEFHDPERGWTPVEMMTWSLGKRVMTERNITTVEVRRRIEQDTAAFDSYCFGSLDPYRIHVSPFTNRLPTQPTFTSGTERAMHRLFWYNRHTLALESDPAPGGDRGSLAGGAA